MMKIAGGMALGGGAGGKDKVEKRQIKIERLRKIKVWLASSGIRKIREGGLQRPRMRIGYGESRHIKSQFGV